MKSQDRQVAAILRDPNSVVHYAELLRPLTLPQITQIWAAVQNDSVVEWAHDERNSVRVPKERQSPKRGYVYLCRDKITGLTKIGFSTKPAYREATLQSQQPQVEFIMVFAGTLADERLLHVRLSKRRRRGEWFDLSSAEIDSVATFFDI